MSFKIGQKITIQTGTIVSQTDYLDLGLTYYCVKVYNPYIKIWDLIYVEKKQLEYLMSLGGENISSSHILNYDPNTSK